MIDFSKINNGIDKINMPVNKEIDDTSNEIVSNVSQHELMNTIHIEFQKPFIKKLYPNPKWTERVFWNVAGVLQQKYYDELPLTEIIEGIKRYLTEHKLIIPTIKEVN